MENDAKKLLDKYLSGTCSPEEKALVEQWYLQLPYEKPTPGHDLIEEGKEQVWKRLSPLIRPRTVPFLKAAGIAAGILMCLSVGIYFFARDQKISSLVSGKPLHDIKPGADIAILTLADGRKVNLDDAAQGEIAVQNGIIIRKRKDGQIEYVLTDSASANPGINIISTPRGGKYQVSLPDGTRVWINAASSLKYPYAFAKNERSVELEGEAYFEVAKDKNRPFRVMTSRQTVEVLGTHFNINSYSDEAYIKTTLVEGRVKVKSASQSIALLPGEQSQLVRDNNRISISKQVDLERETAWKNDLFSFDNDDLQTVMRQISRWYDVDIIYKGRITKETYTGEIPRNSRLSEVLRLLELNNVHADINGKVLTISETR